MKKFIQEEIKKRLGFEVLQKNIILNESMENDLGHCEFVKFRIENCSQKHIQYIIEYRNFGNVAYYEFRIHNSATNDEFRVY